MTTTAQTDTYKTLGDFFPAKEISNEGFFLDRDGSQGFVLELKGIDVSSFTASDWNELHEKWRAFLWLQPNEELQVVFRKHTNFEELFEKKLSDLHLLDDELRRKLYWKQVDELIRLIGTETQVFQSSIVLIYRRFEGIKPSLQAKPNLALSKRELEDRLQALRYQLEEMGLSAQNLSKTEIYREIFSAVHSSSYISSPSLAQEWPDVQLSPKSLTVDGESVRTLYLKKLPEEYSELGMLRALCQLPFSLSLSVRLRGKKIGPVKKRFERKRQILFGMASKKATGDPVAETQFREADELLRRLTEQNDGLLGMTFTLSLRGKDDLFLRQALNALYSVQSNLHQLEFHESPINSFDCFLETIPLFYGQVFHEHSILSSNALAFLPFFQSDEGDDAPILSYPTQDGNLYHLNPISNRLANFNWLVSGTSGAGKSFFVNSLLLQSLRINPRIWIVDIGGSYNKLTEFLGGKLIGLDVNKGFQIGPFFMPKVGNEGEERRRREHIEIIFREMCRDEGKLPSIEERAILSEALEPLFEAKKLADHPIQELSRRLSEREDPKAKRLALLLRRWAYPNFFGSFLDNSNPLEISDDVVTFDLKGLQEFEELSRVVQLIICSALWNSLREKKRFTYIVLDEVAFSLLKSQPQFVDELVSTVRKHFAGVITVVQGIEKITSNNVAGASILNNSARKAILQQRGQMKGWEEPLSVNETESQIIRSLGRIKGQYSDIFLMDEEKRSVLRFAPDPLTYWLSTSDSRDNEQLSSAISDLKGDYSDRIFQFVERRLSA